MLSLHLFTHWHCTLFLCRKHQQGEAVESRNGSWRRSAAFFKMIYIFSKMWDTMSFYIHISFHVCWCVNLFQVQKVQNRGARDLQRGQRLEIIHDKNVWHSFPPLLAVLCLNQWSWRISLYIWRHFWIHTVKSWFTPTLSWMSIIKKSSQFVKTAISTRWSREHSGGLRGCAASETGFGLGDSTTKLPRCFPDP